MSEALIELVGIERCFRVGEEEVHALRSVDLSIAAGEYLSIMGPSGSGKSSLLHLLGLLDRPNAGRYLLAGRDVTGLVDDQLARVRREKIGFVFQFFHLVPRLTAAQNIELPMMLAGIEPTERAKQAAELLTAYGLEARARHRPDQLSGGQCQRVAIARAMAMRPSVILADEPTGNLDRASGIEIIALLERLHEGAGATLVIVTHDGELGGRAPRQLHIRDGRVVGDQRKSAP